MREQKKRVSDTLFGRFFFVLFVLIVLLSSCKKQVFQEKLHVKDEVRVQDKNKEKLFSPISESQAKKFALEKKLQDLSVLTQINRIDHINDHINNESIQDLAEEDFHEFVRQKEAKLFDVPVPLDSEPIKEYFTCAILSAQDKHKTMLGYNNSMDLESVITFYNQEMERLGWQAIACFEGFEKLLLFKKPSSFCCISVRPFNKVIKRSSRTSGKKVRELCKIVICLQV